MKKLFTIAVSCLLLSGCAYRVGDFTVLSTSNINLNEGQFVTGKRIEGSDTVPIILFQFGVPNIESAIESAVYSEENNCIVGLENVTLTQRYFDLLVGFNSYEIEGNAIYDTSRPNCKTYTD